MTALKRLGKMSSTWMRKTPALDLMNRRGVSARTLGKGAAPGPMMPAKRKDRCKRQIRESALAHRRLSAVTRARPGRFVDGGERLFFRHPSRPRDRRKQRGRQIANNHRRSTAAR